MLTKFILDPCTSPKIAKRAASFMACKLLRRFEALDEHLLPIRMLTGPGVEEVKDENGKTVGSKKRQIGYEVRFLYSRENFPFLTIFFSIYRRSFLILSMSLHRLLHNHHSTGLISDFQDQEEK